MAMRVLERVRGALCGGYGEVAGSRRELPSLPFLPRLDMWPVRVVCDTAGASIAESGSELGFG
jgi:hypothetical protein